MWRKVAVILVVLALGSRVCADPLPPEETAPYLHLHTPSTVVTDGGAHLRLPPGYFQTEPEHDRVDAEMHRLQDQETRLTEQNRVMREETSGWTPGWKSLLAATVTGIALGVYVGLNF